MADPISIFAIAGLAYAGKKLSERHVEKLEPKEIPPPSTNPFSNTTDGYAPKFDTPTDYGSSVVEKKIEMPTFSDVAPQYRTSGSEVLDMRNRMYDAGRMNNLSPVEQELVGPGIGVGPDVASYGGYQQLFRVNPENVGAYRLTTLPGRSGPAHDPMGGRRAVDPNVGFNRPEKTAFLPDRRPTTLGRAQGMSAVVPRGEHEHGKRTTNRSETGQRTDGLQYAGAKRTVSNLAVAQNPTRNKKDGNMEQFAYNNQPAPGIHKFAHGYLSSPGSKIGESRVYGSGYTVEQLKEYGFRPEDRRGKANRMANAGRMNVRDKPLNQNGMLTSVRTDVSRTDGRFNPVSGGWTQQYTNSSHHQLNPYKGHMNPHATSASLDTAKHQLSNNPLAHSIN